MSPPKATPMIKQYLSIKGQYEDAVLFYRMGDFYEMFFEDAKVASKVLDIALTSRNKNDQSPVPMCGVPHKAAQGYIARMIEAGHKVAICDQVEDPSTAKGLVKREVVQVITPGMIVDNALLDAKTNNYVLAITHRPERIGLAYLDLSTGTFRLTESVSLDQIIEESLRIDPQEFLLPESTRSDGLFEPVLRATAEKAVTYMPDDSFSHSRARDRLLQQFGTVSLEGFGCEDLSAGISAAGAVLKYVKDTQKQQVDHIDGIETYTLEAFLWIDDLSCRNLELLQNIRTGSRRGTLLDILDQTVTAMGGRLFRNWMRYPPLDLKTIGSRHDAVQEALDHRQNRSQIKELLKSVADLERLGSKISMGKANARDLTAVKHSLQTLPQILECLSDLQSELFAWNEKIDRLTRLADLIERSIREDAPPTIQDGGIIRSGYNAELDDLVRISRDAKGYLAQLEIKEREATDITTLKVRYNKVFGYYIEVPKARSDQVPQHYVRKQTLVNAERYITDELKDFENRVLNAEEQRCKLEYQIFNDVREQVLEHHGAIQRTARFLSRCDCIFNLAEVADRNDFHRPEINTDGIIHIEDGRHPVVEKMISGERFVPNTIRMDNTENQILVITGPNMAGKSTVLRQVALTVLMAQMGSFVPARQASVCLTDRIFTRVGALDNLSQGLSTFLVEMQETANILHNATDKSLVIMDEIGRGTSTFDGLSIAWAVAEFLHDMDGVGVKTLFATHYHELTELAATKDRVRNYNIAVKEWNDEIIFLRKLVVGGTNRSYGIQVARLAGIPRNVILRAKKILSQIEEGNLTVNKPSVKDSGRTDKNKNEQQLSLFRKPEDSIIEKLAKLDVSQMTPLQALNYLDELRELAREISK